MATPSNQPPGLYRKFDVSRLDGRDQPGGDRAGAEYLVLDLTYCPFARGAAMAYADAMAQAYPQAASDIREKIASMPLVPPEVVVLDGTASVPTWRVLEHVVRVQIARGELALMALREGSDPPVTLALGEALGPSTRAGAVMAKLLQHSGRAPWFIFGCRPAGRRGASSVCERDAADRIMAAARLVDLPVAAVVLVTEVGGTLLVESKPEWFTQTGRATHVIGQGGGR